MLIKCLIQCLIQWSRRQKNTCFRLSAAHLKHTHTLLKGVTRDKVIHTSASPTPTPTPPPPPAPPTGTFSPGSSSVIVMKGNGAEKGRKGDFPSYLVTPTVGGSKLTENTATRVPTVDLLQDDSRNNIGLIVNQRKKTTTTHLV